MLSRISRTGTAVAISALAAIALTSCGSDNPVGTTGGSTGADGSTESSLSGELNGAGASSQESAMEAWRAGFGAQNPDVNVNYDPVGSGGGRTQFLAGGVAFAGSDSALSDDEIAQSTSVCGADGAIDLPIYVSPIAVVFNLDGIKELNLAPATIAGIFAGTITNWNAAEIAADNPGVTLPDLAITPVHRSDESGTTKNFTDYLHATAPEAWTPEADGNWPTQGGESAQGTSGVVQTVQGGKGTISYADASKAGDLGTAKIKVGDEWVAFSPKAAALVVDASPRVEGRHEHDIAVEIDRTTTEAGAYPLVLISYGVACLNYSDAETGELVKAFFTYITSAEGQDAAASAAGSAPISDDLRSDVTAAIEAITAG